MKKLSLKKLNLEPNDVLARKQLKTVLGGYGRDGFDCAYVYMHCDSFESYNSFQACMGARGC